MDIHGVAIHLNSFLHGAEVGGPAGAGVLLMDAIQTPGHISGGHLAIAPLELHPLAQIKAIALAIVQHVVGVGQRFRRVILAIFADSHQHLIAGIEVHTIESAPGLEAVGATHLAKVGDVQRATARLMRHLTGWHRLRSQGGRRQQARQEQH